MITCAARTGSTLLQSYLQSHPEILCHGEIYAKNNINAILGIYGQKQKSDPEYEKELIAYRENNPHTFLYKIAFDRQDRKIVGFKLKHDELVLPNFAETRHLLQEDTDVKIIHLSRTNLLARYLSWYLVNKVTGVTMRLEGQDLPETEMIRLDPKECLANFEEAERRYAFFQTMFANHQIYEVSYEDLVGEEREGVLDELQDFLGVAHHPLTTKMVKLGKEDLSEAIENFDELSEFFKETRYGSFFA
ncbi:MAG: sulfotransferase [Geitlerinemataceae cyanobacterium]